ncbi:hypothetical protein E2C01_001435 [Portunus trituberculatus]|uniref:Uncharacterized protein n=1 Tax=Portunus trituberculatus TaxID=210409 RepID=A0A5B7CHM3_PORTR|nr:hypothetical protein [Portunus trituberculatus]
MLCHHQQLDTHLCWPTEQCVNNLRIAAREGDGPEATFQHTPNTTTDSRWSLQPPHDNDTRPVRSPSTVAVPCGPKDGTPVSIPRLVMKMLRKSVGVGWEELRRRDRKVFRLFVHNVNGTGRPQGKSSSE